MGKQSAELLEEPAMRRRRKTWKFGESWLGRWLQSRAGIRERFCSKCNQPYVTSPEAKPKEQFFSCSSAALVYATRRFGKPDYVIRLGRWRPNRTRLDLVQIFESDDLDDLLNAIRDAKSYIDSARKAESDERRADLKLY